MLFVYSVIVTLSATAIKTGLGIRCYVCNSKQNHRCADPFNTSIILDLQPVDCTNDPSSSRSALETVRSLITRLEQDIDADTDDTSSVRPTATDSSEFVSTTCQKLDLRVMGELVTERGCSGPVQNKLSPCDAIKLITIRNLQLEYCGFCSTDGCNTATDLGVSRLGFTSSILLMTRRLLWA
ncbi:UPAR/Ly6 domain-containing protein crok-like [Periplaneta americana]|uniref:UPAR/Ly6 domain-containing protein crok-like n=1 Tax=Periplaneta americana TaxID=6978 RepID=UPI0037E78FE1